MRNAWILVAIAAALAALACGTGPTEAPEPTATPTWQEQQIIETTVEARVTAELTQLAPTKTRSTDPTTASVVVSTPTPGVTPAPTSPSVPTPTAVVIPTPTRPGICGRTPEVQQAIIETLRIASCRLITEHELYRIRDLPEIGAPELRSGDFTGLVNLNSLSVQLRPLEKTNPAVIPAGTFTGSRILYLALSNSSSSDSRVTIEDGAFDGAHVKYLSIYLAEGGPVYDQSGELAGYRAFGRLPDSLPESLTWLRVSGDLRSLDWKIFQALPELEYLSLIHDQARPGGTPTPVAITLPADALTGNPKLRGLELKGDSSWGKGTFQVSTRLLAEHEYLAHVSIDKMTLYDPRANGLPIQVHPDSPAAAYAAEQGLREWSGWEEEHDFRLRAASFPG